MSRYVKIWYFCRKLLKCTRYEPKIWLQVRWEPTPHFLPLCYIIIKVDDEEISGYHFLDNKIDLRFFFHFCISHVYHFLDYKNIHDLAVWQGVILFWPRFGPDNGHTTFNTEAPIPEQVSLHIMFDNRWLFTLTTLISKIIGSIVCLSITILDDRLLQNECGLWSLWWSGHSFHCKLHAIR